jgi:stress response protein YsnF
MQAASTGSNTPLNDQFRIGPNIQFRSGAYSVSVTTVNEDEGDEVERILNEAGAVDIDDRSAQWRQEGWTPNAETTADNSAANNKDKVALEVGDTRKLQEVEEELQVGKRSVARGGVRIFQRVTEVPVQESVRLREEHANVQRHAADRPATEAELATLKEGSIEVREMAEEAVVSKTARVVGEVEVGKQVTEREQTVKDTVRKTKVEVERMN